MSRKYLPECWQDDTRMNALFSPFRSRDANPQAWESKLHFWRNSILQWCRSTKRVYFTLNELMSAFERNGKSPQGFQTVISELLRQKELVKLSDYGQLEDDEKWLSWGINILLKRPITWSLAAISNTLNKSENTEDNFISIEIIQEKALEVVQHHQSNVEYPSTDNVVELNSLWEKCTDMCHSEDEFQTVLLYLRKEKMIKIHVSNEMKLIKFKEKNENIASPITEADIGIFRLKKAKECLKSRIEKLEDKIQNHISEARMHLKSDSKPLARAALRRKKSCEKVLAKREVALENLEQLLQRIQEMESEKMILDAYQSGVEGFQKTLAESGITIDKVDDTTVAIQEMFDMNEDIQEALSQSITGEGDISELEAELEELITAEEPPPPPLEPPVPPKIDYEKDVQLPDISDLLQNKCLIDTPDELPSVPSPAPSGDSGESTRTKVYE